MELIPDISSNAYNEIVIFWFNNKKNWFSCPEEFDNLIITTYKSILNLQLYLNLEFYQNLDKNHLLGKIILLDQFSRHIYRNNSNEIKKYDKLALSLLQKYNLSEQNFIDQFTPEERCFLIMPYRHTFNEIYLIKCITFINIWKIDNYHVIYRRFYEATLKALIKINNEKDLLYENCKNSKNIQLNDINSILDSNSLFNLERLQINNSNINNSNINNSNINNIDSTEHGFQISELVESEVFQKLYKEFIKNMKGFNKIYVSVSGGVDSMVCLYLLYIYKMHFPELNLEIGAISINYNNRSEQYTELFMVSKFCEYLNIKYYVREITELVRTRDSDRELYESITRQIRFDAYKKMECPIILGHNTDDCLENIFINLKNKAKYNNLLGMEIRSMERDVVILRPLLNINKSDIVELAHQCNIPYIYDSTCTWSNRGKMRDALIPAINNFDGAILPNLITFVKNYNEIYKIYEKSIDKIDYYNNYCIVDHANGVMFFEYYKKIFTIICKKYNVKFVKNKAIEYLIECLEKNLENKITLSKNLIVKKINNNIHVFIKLN